MVSIPKSTPLEDLLKPAEPSSVERIKKMTQDAIGKIFGDGEDIKEDEHKKWHVEGLLKVDVATIVQRMKNALVHSKNKLCACCHERSGKKTCTGGKTATSCPFSKDSLVCGHADNAEIYLLMELLTNTLFTHHIVSPRERNLCLAIIRNLSYVLLLLDNESRKFNKDKLEDSKLKKFFQLDTDDYEHHRGLKKSIKEEKAQEIQQWVLDQAEVLITFLDAASQRTDPKKTNKNQIETGDMAFPLYTEKQHIEEFTEELGTYVLKPETESLTQ